MNDKPEISVRLIRLSDGTLIDPLTRQPISSSPRAEDENEEVVDDGAVTQDLLAPPGTIVATTRRSMLDLTLNSQQMAVVNNVLVYTLWGLPDDEIAIQCKCDLADVLTVRELREYKTMHDALIDGMRASYTATAHGVISKSAISAANVVVSNLRSGSKRMAFDAARDILDRSGHRPSDHSGISVSINQGRDDQLVIRVVRESERPHIPTLDIHSNGA